MLRPMLPPEPQAKTRPAPLATFEAASALLESDLRWDRVAERDRYMQCVIAHAGITAANAPEMIIGSRLHNSKAAHVAVGRAFRRLAQHKRPAP